MKDVAVTRLFKETFDAEENIIIHRGGARSSKSYSILQYLIWRLTNEPNCQILITRKTMPALRITAYKVFIELLKEYGYYNYCSHRLTDSTITYLPNGSFVAFLSIDNPERIKSSEWNVVFMEEGFEFSYNDYTILKTRLSAPTKIGNKLIVGFNPVSALHWLKTSVVDKEESLKEIVSNYKDNPFLSPEYIKTLEDLAKIDKNFYRIYTLGEWGSLDNIIYSDWEEVSYWPLVERTIFGCDFGFNSPTAIVEVGLTNEGTFLRERLYQSGMTNSDLVAWIKKQMPNAGYIYCDNAEPNRIMEMKRAGINAYPADKSVKDGIDFVKRHQLKVLNTSINILSEIQQYKYKEDKLGNVLDEPVKFNDHHMDAIRYALYTHLGKKKEYFIMTV